MSHARYEEMLAVYRDLHGPERAEVDEHVRGCPECARRLEAYDAMDRELAALPDAEPSGRLRQRFYAGLAKSRRPWARLGYAVEGAIVVLLVAGAWLVIQGGLRAGWLGRPASGRTPVPATTRTPLPTAPTATVTPEAGWLPAGTVALYSVGSGESLDLYALGADGSATGLGRELPPGSLASHDGRWVVHLDAPQPAASAVVVESLQDGRSYTIPLGVDCSQDSCIVGLWAFDREGTRLAFVEVAMSRWALVVVDLRDGSSRRFEALRTGDGRLPLAPGTPLGWAATGELLLDTFPPFSEGACLGVWALTLPAGGSPAAIDALGRRQLVAAGAYLHRPQLSPDGTRLLYLARDRAYTPAGYTLNGGFEDVAVNQLWSLDIASGRASRLVEVKDGGALGYPAAWSPDGREALFAQGRYVDGQTLSELTLKAVDAAGAVREIGPLAAQGYLSDLRWCAPGLALAAVYPGGEVSELYLVDLASGRTAFVGKGQQVSVLGVMPAQAGEEVRPSPMPPAQTGMLVLRSLHMIDEETGWALGDGALLRTTDGGRRWRDVTPTGVKSGAITCEFLDGERAWVAAGGGMTATEVTICRTADGGRSWQSSALPATFGGGVNGLYLSAGDLNCAWLVVEPMHGMGSSPGLLYATTDGGGQWTLVAGHEVPDVKDTLPYGGAIRFINSTTGWTSGVTANTRPSSLSVTRDGGRTWQPVELPRPAGYSQGHLSVGLPRFFARGSEDGILAAEFWPGSAVASEYAIIIYVTRDGGRTWQATTPLRNGGAGDFIDAQEGWVWAAEPGTSVWRDTPVKGALHHTRDGGRTWQALEGTPNLTAFLQQGGGVAQLDFVSNDIGWAVVSGADGQTTQLVRTQDGGRSWSVVDARVGEPAGVTSSVVDGWTGKIVGLDSMAQFDDYFLRSGGEKYGIDGSAAGLTPQLEKAREQGATMRVWGRLVLRDPATGQEREVRLAPAEVYAPAGKTVWSPDGSELMLTLASGVCAAGEATHSILRVDAETLALTTLVDRDSRLFTTEAWPEAGRVQLADEDGKRWWLDAGTGRVAKAE